MSKKLNTILIFLTLLGLSCGSIQIETAPRLTEPTPTPTSQPVVIGRNTNADALTETKAAIGNFSYGFAPLLLLTETRLTITETATSGEAIQLSYPPQPADLQAWVSVDSFGLAYAVQAELNTKEAVANAQVGQVRLTAPLADQRERILHYAVWVDFADGSGTTVDLSPLAPDFGAYYASLNTRLTTVETTDQFAKWRRGVLLTEWQPLTVGRVGQQLYYLSAQATVSAERYTFAIQVHPYQAGSHVEQVSLGLGSRATLSINRADFAPLQALLRDEGETIFNDQPDLWEQTGADEFDLNGMLNGNLNLLWHMVVKLEN